MLQSKTGRCGTSTRGKSLGKDQLEGRIQGISKSHNGFAMQSKATCVDGAYYSREGKRREFYATASNTEGHAEKQDQRPSEDSYQYANT